MLSGRASYREALPAPFPDKGAGSKAVMLKNRCMSETAKKRKQPARSGPENGGSSRSPVRGGRSHKNTASPCARSGGPARGSAGKRPGGTKNRYEIKIPHDAGSRGRGRHPGGGLP